MRREFTWSFIIADVKHAILGVDFLSFYNLTVNVGKRKIVDNTTQLSVNVDTLACSDANRIGNVFSCSNQFLLKLINDFPDLTSPSYKPSPLSTCQHRIPTTGHPCRAKARPLSSALLKPAREAIKQMLADGIIRPSRSEWGSPLHMVPKKDNSWRPVGDYRALNKITKPDTYTLPFLTDFTAELNGKKVFARIDLKSAFLQVPIHEDDIPKTTIVTPFGSYEFLKMNFGLCSASQTFQRFLDEALRDLSAPTSEGGSRPVTFFNYIDDILIASDDDEQHLEDMRALFTRLTHHGLKINPLKCELGASQLDFLGHRITSEGIAPLPEKVKAIQDFQRPEKAKGLRRFLGMLNFYRRFLPRAASTLAPLYAKLAGIASSKKNPTLSWTSEEIEAFERSKSLLAEATMLSHPIPGTEMCIACDASNTAVAAVLQQTVNGVTMPISFFSRSLTSAQKNYSVFGKELLAIYLALKQFKYLIQGVDFFILTDHKPLIGAVENPSQRDNPREVRQLQFISSFTSRISHLSGDSNVVADALSRSLPEDPASETDDQLSISALFVHEDEANLALEQEKDEELKAILTGRTPTSLTLVRRNGIVCEFDGRTAKPYVPACMRRKIFEQIHNVSHPGARSSLKQVRARFIWPRINSDIKLWTKCCSACQRAKITRHNVSAVSAIPTEGGKFDQLHVDLVGPLPYNKGYTYLLTMIDRFSRWTEAVPLADITAETVANAILHNWIARFGVPVSISSDRGAQFESSIMKSLMQTLGCLRITTTAYHPRANGIIERFHRRLKDALRASADPHHWVDKLPLILLSLRTAIRDDGQPSMSDIVYGTPLRLPIDLLYKNDQPFLDPSSYTERLQAFMQSIGPIKTRSPSSHSHIDPNLLTCEYVFVRNNARTGLNPNYSGPFKVLKRSNKYYHVQFPNRTDTVTIDRLKAAHLQNDVLSNVHNTPKRVPIPIPVKNPLNPMPINQTAPAASHPAETSTSTVQTPRVAPTAAARTRVSFPDRTANIKTPVLSTRRGRQVRRPARYN